MNSDDRLQAATEAVLKAQGYPLDQVELYPHIYEQPVALAGGLAKAVLDATGVDGMVAELERFQHLASHHDAEAGAFAHLHSNAVDEREELRSQLAAFRDVATGEAKLHGEFRAQVRTALSGLRAELETERNEIACVVRDPDAVLGYMAAMGKLSATIAALGLAKEGK